MQHHVGAQRACPAQGQPPAARPRFADHPVIHHGRILKPACEQQRVARAARHDRAQLGLPATGGTRGDLGSGRGRGTADRERHPKDGQQRWVIQLARGKVLQAAQQQRPGGLCRFVMVERDRQQLRLGPPGLFPASVWSTPELARTPGPRQGSHRPTRGHGQDRARYAPGARGPCTLAASARDDGSAQPGSPARPPPGPARATHQPGCPQRVALRAPSRGRRPPSQPLHATRQGVWHRRALAAPTDPRPDWRAAGDWQPAPHPALPRPACVPPWRAARRAPRPGCRHRWQTG